MTLKLVSNRFRQFFFVLTIVVALTVVKIACASGEGLPACAKELNAGQEAQVTKTAGTSLQGDPFALPGDSFGEMLAPQSVEVPTYSLGGYFESRNQLSLNDFESPTSLRQRLQLEGNKRWEQVFIYGSFRADYDAAAPYWDYPPHNPWDVRVHELYLSIDTDHVDVIAGQKIERWGTGDGINPMDLINPVDARDPFASGRADNRLASPLISVVGYVGDWSLEGVFLPLAKVSDIPDQGSPWAGNSIGTLYEAQDSGQIQIKHEQPTEWFSQSAFGGRLSTNLDGWDVSVLAYSGYILFPVWQPSTVGNNDYIATHPRFTAFGANFARAVGGASTFRGEVAYKPKYTLNLSGNTCPYTGDLWQGVLGWDYDIDGKYYLNVQAFSDWFQGRVNAESTRTRSWHGITYEASAKFLNDDVKTGFRGRIYSSNDGMINEFFTEYALDDHWKIQSGVILWDGPVFGVLGLYADNDLFYFNVLYSF